MRRRRFLTCSAQATFSLSLIPLAACAHRNRTAAKSNTTAPPHPLVVDLEAQIPKLMADANVPGLSIAVIHDTKLVWRRGFGFKDVATKAPVDNDTIFEAASMSKPAFAYAALKLCEEGVIGLDTPLTKYAPEPFLTGDPRLELITPRHVLSHSSGFQNWRSQKEPLKINFSPGSQYTYSGEGYYYLQSVITHLKGKVNVQDNGLINHGGDNKGFHCHAIASPKTKSGLVVMTNGDDGPKIIQELFAQPALGHFFEALPIVPTQIDTRGGRSVGQRKAGR